MSKLDDGEYWDEDLNRRYKLGEFKPNTWAKVLLSLVVLVATLWYCSRY